MRSVSDAPAAVVDDRPADRRALRIVCGTAFLALTALRIWGEAALAAPGRKTVRYLCEPPLWVTAANLGMVAEPVLGILLIAGSARIARRAGFVGGTWMTIVAVASTYLGLTGELQREHCGCFGPVDAPWWLHPMVAAPLAAGCILVFDPLPGRRRGPVRQP